MYLNAHSEVNIYKHQVRSLSFQIEILMSLTRKFLLIKTLRVRRILNAVLRRDEYENKNCWKCLRRGLLSLACVGD
jgi:hypothetical protein